MGVNTTRSALRVGRQGLMVEEADTFCAAEDPTSAQARPHRTEIA